MGNYCKKYCINCCNTFFAVGIANDVAILFSQIIANAIAFTVLFITPNLPYHLSRCGLLLPTE